MGNNYAKEKLVQGLYSLAVADLPLRVRLRNAWIGFHTLKASDFSGNEIQEWMQIDNMLKIYGPILNEDGSVKIGSVENTLSKLSDEEITNLAGNIFNLALEVIESKIIRNDRG